MIQRTFTEEKTVKFNEHNPHRSIAVNIDGEGYLEVQVKVNGGYQMVDTIYHSGVYPMLCMDNMIKFIPVVSTGTLYYSMSYDVGEIQE